MERLHLYKTQKNRDILHTNRTWEGYQNQYYSEYYLVLSYIVDLNYLDPILYGDLLLKMMVIKE